MPSQLVCKPQLGGAKSHIPVLERRCICVPRRVAPLLALAAGLALPDCETAMCTEFIDVLDKILW